MTRSIVRRTAGITALFALLCATTACATDTEAQPDPSNAGGVVPEEVHSQTEPAGNEDRAFDASDDNVLLTVETTFESENARAEWAGSTLRVSMDGSVDAPTASLPCLAIEALLADGEDVTLVFSDGELVCADRATAN